MKMLGYRCMANWDLRGWDMGEIAVRVFERQECWKSDPWQAGCLDESRIPVSG